MTTDDLTQILQYPESENIEYKEAKTQYGTDKLIKYCVAFANERGGRLLLGIKDNKEVCGTNAFPLYWRYQI